MPSVLTCTVLLGALSSVPLFGQIDRAHGDIYNNFKGKFATAFKYAEDGEQKKAIGMFLEMAKDMDELLGYCRDVPDKLNDGNMRDLAAKTKLFRDELDKKFRELLKKLVEKLNYTTADYRSELSDLRSQYSVVNADFQEVWSDFLRLGRVLKTTCPNDCFR